MTKQEYETVEADTGEAMDTYGHIIEQCENDVDMLRCCYNTLLITASLLANDLGEDVKMPFSGNKVWH